MKIKFDSSLAYQHDAIAAVVQTFAGQPLADSEWLTVDQSRIDAFAQATSDHQWIHVDPVQAAASPVGTTIAHGYLTLASPKNILATDILPAEDITSAFTVRSKTLLNGEFIEALLGRDRSAREEVQTLIRLAENVMGAVNKRFAI